MDDKETMLRIGEFARICNVSAQTLRYYDSIGVLKADYVDTDSGYRYYAPDKLAIYHRIADYKEVGFSLDEIRVLLNAAPEQKQTMFEERRRVLLAERQAAQERITRLDILRKSGESLERTPPVCVPYFSELCSEFIDDPEAVGRWELLGTLPALTAGERWTEHLDLIAGPSDDPSFLCSPSITFLPGGRPYWVFFWTSGVLFTSGGALDNYCIPNPYEIARVGNETLMLIKFFDLEDIWDSGRIRQQVYRRVDQTHYTEETVRLFIDDIELPYEADEQVLGCWRSVAFVRDTEDFRADTQGNDAQLLPTHQMIFRERGMGTKVLYSGGSTSQSLMEYTRGYVLNRWAQTAERYFIQRIAQREYLFVEHKSGDYMYGGLRPYWYVFVREEDAESNDNL